MAFREERQVSHPVGEPVKLAVCTRVGAYAGRLQPDVITTPKNPSQDSTVPALTIVVLS